MPGISCNCWETRKNETSQHHRPAKSQLIRRRFSVSDEASQVTELHFVAGDRRIGHGIGQMLGQLAHRGMYPPESAIDLAILAAVVTAADTRISRAIDAQDSWTREIDVYVPVAKPDRWSENGKLDRRGLSDSLRGDIWRIVFRPRQKGMDTLIDRSPEPLGTTFDSICLFSGGLDSFVGAIDLLEAGSSPLFVSHYHDASTKSQEICANRLGEVYGDLGPRHVRANVELRQE